MKEPVGWLLVALSLAMLAKVDLSQGQVGEPSGMGSVIAADRKSNRLRVYRSSGELVQEIRITRPDDSARNTQGDFGTSGRELVVVNQPSATDSDNCFHLSPVSGELIAAE
ncbi:MAG: hypothetical protein U0795_00365 [Pirellulales bacterium]